MYSYSDTSINRAGLACLNLGQFGQLEQQVSAPTRTRLLREAACSKILDLTPHDCRDVGVGGQLGRLSTVY